MKTQGVKIMGIERVLHNGKELAIIIKSDYHSEGIEFITSDDYSQQLAYMHHPAGKKIDAHIHNHVERSVAYTQEVLVIREGKLRVDFYNENQEYLESKILNKSDTILLTSGGHGFKVLEEVEMIEIKQGPYAGEQDKTRFKAVADEQVIFKSEE